MESRKSDRKFYDRNKLKRKMPKDDTFGQITDPKLLSKKKKMSRDKCHSKPIDRVDEVDTDSESDMSGSERVDVDMNLDCPRKETKEARVKKKSKLLSEDNPHQVEEESDANHSDDSNESSASGDSDLEEGATVKSPETDDELVRVKKELANMPLEDLMKIKEKLGLKVFNKIMHGDKFDAKKRVFKRENKNRPMEMSSKRRVPVLRHNEVAKEKVRRDPRFDDLSGEFQDRHFEKNFSFLTDVKAREKELVERKLKKTKDEEKKSTLTKLLKKMTQQEEAESRKQKRQQLEQQWKDKEKELVKEGKTPYFLKKADKKKLELAEKFKELEKSGKVDHYLSKKRKKNAQKEKKKLPSRHQRFS